MKTKLWKVLSVGLTLGLLASLAVAPAVSVAAAEQEWSKVAMPNTQPGTDVGPIVISPDGTIIYAAVGNVVTFQTDPDAITISDGTLTATQDGFISGTLTVTGTIPDGLPSRVHLEDLVYSVDSGVSNATLNADVSISGNTLTISGTFTDLSLDGDQTWDVSEGSIAIDADGKVGLELTWTVTASTDPNDDALSDSFTLTEPTTPGTLIATKVMKSTDGGYSWTATPLSTAGKVVDMAVSTDGTLYVATYGAVVYRVTATTAQPLQPPVDNSGNRASAIYSIDVWNDGSDNWVMVATNNDVLVLRDAPIEGWRDQELNESAYWAGFAPDYNTSHLMWAVYADDADNDGDSDTVITATTSPVQWGTEIQDIVIHDFIVSAKSDVVFPDTYSSSAPILFAALNGASDAIDTNDTATTTAIYRCETGLIGTVPVVNKATISVPAGVQSIDSISNLAYSSGAIYAGVGHTTPTPEIALVLRSTDGGDSFAPVTKSPTGTEKTYVGLLAGGAVIAVTSGAESGVSLSTDGVTFNQISYIDTVIASIADVAFDPESNGAVMLTRNTTATDSGNTSLWRTLDRTASTVFWERVGLRDYGAGQLIEYALDGTAIFWYDGKPAGSILRSTNNAQSFTVWKNLTSGTINDWVMPTSNKIYAALSNGFWGTTALGSMAITLPTTSGVTLTSIDLSGEAIVVGTSDGKVWYSPELGYTGTWKNVSPTWPTGTTPGDTYVAFAEGSDVMVYAARGDKLYRLTDATATAPVWVEVVTAAPEVEVVVDGTTETEPAYELEGANAIVSAPAAGNAYEGSGVAYVADSDEVLRVRGVGPKVEDEDTLLSPAYETIGAPAGTDSLKGIWYTPGSNVLWSVVNNNSLWTYTDILNVSGTGVAVSDVATTTSYICVPGACGGEVFAPQATASATISFSALPGATGYKVVVNTTPQTNFYTAASPVGSDDTTTTDDVVVTVDGTTATVTGLKPATTYYVSVWAKAPVSSFLFGGNTVSFTTPPVAPGAVQPFLSPEPGALNVPVNPTFQWVPVAGADHYEFQLSTNPSFSGASTVTVDGTYYAAEGLDYETAYYWRVRAVMADGTAGGWVASVFSTAAEPVPPAPPVTVTVTAPGATQTITAPAVTVTAPPQTITMPAEETPVYVWAVIGIGAVLVIAVVVLIVRTRRTV